MEIIQIVLFHIPFYSGKFNHVSFSKLFHFQIYFLLFHFQRVSKILRFTFNIVPRNIFIKKINFTIKMLIPCLSHINLSLFFIFHQQNMIFVSLSIALLMNDIQTHITLPPLHSHFFIMQFAFRIKDTRVVCEYFWKLLFVVPCEK